MSRLVQAIVAAAAAFGAIAPAGGEPISVRDSFRIGSGGTSFCSAQSSVTDAALTSMFDTGYIVTCRDAALPVGKLYKLRDLRSAPGRLTAARAADVDCGASHPDRLGQLGAVEVTDCKLRSVPVAYRVYALRKGSAYYAVEGLAGYDSALRLGLESLVLDRAVPGDVSIATTGLGDPAAFARVQAGSLDPAKALAEAYRRNNSGSYAEAAEFFAAVSNVGDAPLGRSEAMANEGLQKSNLGRFAEADDLFARAATTVGSDSIVARRLRNYRAIHLLNQGDPKGAIRELDTPLPKAALDNDVLAKPDALSIDAITSRRLNAEGRVPQQLSEDTDALLPVEKAQILEGQALQLRGAALHLEGDNAAARDAMMRASAMLEAVRNGKVTSIAWMRAQILGDLGAIAEEANNPGEADRLYRSGVTLLETNYPGSAALLNARARLAGYLARAGQTAAAEAMFRDIVHSQPDTSNLPPSFANVLRPYVDLLLAKAGDPAATAEVFAATQLMVRPGLAQTQAVLARELSGGTDEAARLFRQSVTLSRQVERGQIELARLAENPKLSPDDRSRAAAIKAALDQNEKDQLATQSALAGYPRFRAVAGEVIPLADLQKALRPGETYYHMTKVGDSIYAMLIGPTFADARKLKVGAKQLDDEVTALRETISTIENGQRVTYAFDVGLSHQIYDQLFGPFSDRLAGASNLVFEPDGAMLRLPANLLVMDQVSVDAYAKRAAAGGDAEFDFRGIRWFGRDRDISTSVSPQSFAQLRSAPPSSGQREYLGLGQNSPPSAAEAKVLASDSDRDCTLPMSSWAHPISDKELRVAGSILERMDPNGVAIVTRDAFTDTGLEQRSDLKDYRILHFATHGVVTSRAAKCPAQPALLTSFGGSGSDGLLTFREIFDLRLDADLVILSACDTAGTASTVATQEAGLSRGGDVELDGLVRAFVGAGGRLVIASHWPVPDDYNATERLMTGFFSSPPGTATAAALRASQRKLMDDPDTSHPFYWSAFAVVGDGETPVIRQPQRMAAAK